MNSTESGLPGKSGPFICELSNGWSDKDIEWIDSCPVCNGSNYEFELSGLRDYNCHTVPGNWTLWRCLDCTVRFLNPRLKQNSILRAYEKYPTHTQQNERSSSNKLVHAYRALRDGYLQFRYGLPAAGPILPGWMAWLLPAFLRWEWDFTLRHLIKATPGRSRLLDVGCGNGSFLQLAKQAGWTVTGLDFDPSAVNEAKKLCLEVHTGGLESLRPQQQFDYITLGHVIEHVHDPVDTLKKLEQHLAPGGMIWIATPNVVGPGSRKYRQHWASLETPRHLTLYTRQALSACIDRAGFRPIRWRRRGWNLALSFAQSTNIERRGDRLKQWRDQLDTSLFLRSFFYEALATLGVSDEDELVVVIGRKGSE